ncbi:MAG: hypothetical protein RO257_09010 [Candidatus Kapabacteria bacterium]|nr:hypothetical protein [Candidatus Kapabacteria bacterium]
MIIPIDAEYIVDKDNNKTKVLLSIDEFDKILVILKKYDITFSNEESILSFENNSNDSKNGNRVFGSAKGKYNLSPDFDAPFEDFDMLKC